MTREILNAPRIPYGDPFCLPYQDTVYNGGGVAEAIYAGTWASAGSSFSLACTGPSLCALNSTDLVFADRDNDQLRLYRWGGSSFSLVSGTATAVGMTNPGMARLNSTDFALIDSSFGTGELRTYRFNGTNFEQVGSGLAVATIASHQGIAALSSTRIAHIAGTSDTLRAFDWDGSTWTQTGSGAGVTAGFVSLCKINSTTVAMADDLGQWVRAYSFNGSSWAQVGNTLTITSMSRPALANLNSSYLALYDSGTDKLRTLRWNGTNFTSIAAGLTITSTSGRGWLTHMGDGLVAHIDDNLDTMRMYKGT